MKDVFKIARDDDERLKESATRLEHPELDAALYYRQVASSPYFQRLVLLRHYIRAVSDWYFSHEVTAKNVDLFLMTASISSPSGPGSDSTPIPLSFGGLHTYLVDSSQFGFEPIVVGGTPHTYCYLPSMRGDEPDARHLNQFYHCEYEGQVEMSEAQQIAEAYVYALANLFGVMRHTVESISMNPSATRKTLDVLLKKEPFRQISFDEAAALLEETKIPNLIRATEEAKDITAEGEKMLLTLLEEDRPVWVTKYHRDRVPFYQKPDPTNLDRVLNADLIVPALGDSGFGGEILGLGQRQDNPAEILESLRRQGISAEHYEWYIDLRRLPNYRITSGFGLGIERLISWLLGFDSIHKAILYPRIKGLRMNP